LELDELVELVGRNWDILEKLRQKEHYVTELATELEKAKPQVSSSLKTLADAELVRSEQKEGDRRKYFTITARCEKLIRAIAEATAPEEKHEELKVDFQAIDMCLDFVMDGDLSEDVRSRFATLLFNSIRDAPVLILAEHRGAKQLFEKIAADPPSGEAETDKCLRDAFSTSIGQLVSDQSTSSWVLTTLYPKIKKVMVKKGLPPHLQVWTISVMKSIGRLSPDPEVRDEVRKKFLSMYYDKTLKLEDEGTRRLGLAVLETHYDDSGPAREKFLRDLKEAAKSSDEARRRKAEWLLKEMGERLLSGWNKAH
jgi:DNA-binding MarR family transcriptional regulator